MTVMSSKRSPKKIKSGIAPRIELDEDEILKSMMAARKQGKQREITSDSEQDGSDAERSHQDKENSFGSTPTSSSDHVDPNPSSPPLQLHGQASGSQQHSATSHINHTSRINSANRYTDPKTVAKGLPVPPRPTKSVTFSALGLSQPVITALTAINIKEPTEIQAACIGPIMSGRDCIGGAKTGSGKTMAFALPILERIARDPFGVFAVVLTPTRELAYQLTEQFLVIGRPLGLTTVTIVGGMDTLSQAKELQARPHVIVATPGRLCDLLRSDGQPMGKLSRVRILVLDEADRLLTPTFAPDLAYLFSQIPPNRQTCLFTATISDPIMELATRTPTAGKEAPFVYRVASETLTVANLKQRYLFIPSQIRDSYLYYLLQHPPDLIDAALRLDPRKETTKESLQRGQKRKAQKQVGDEPARKIPSTIIFAQRCATAHLLHLLLNSLDIPSVPLHSHLTQPQRLQSLARFRAADVPVLVTTDVGSRGLDIPEVAMVINWDCPRRADDYVHRVGRTARAGRGGLAITIVTERDVELVKSIEEEVKVVLEELILPEEEVLEHLNAVSVARRVATMEMHDSGFGERQATNKAKQVKRQRRDAAR